MHGNGKVHSFHFKNEGNEGIDTIGNQTTTIPSTQQEGEKKKRKRRENEEKNISVLTILGVSKQIMTIKAQFLVLVNRLDHVDKKLMMKK
jgi:hypothetical protein